MAPRCHCRLQSRLSGQRATMAGTSTSACGPPSPSQHVLLICPPPPRFPFHPAVPRAPGRPRVPRRPRGQAHGAAGRPHPPLAAADAAPAADTRPALRTVIPLRHRPGLLLAHGGRQLGSSRRLPCPRGAANPGTDPGGHAASRRALPCAGGGAAAAAAALAARGRGQRAAAAAPAVRPGGCLRGAGNAGGAACRTGGPGAAQHSTVQVQRWTPRERATNPAKRTTSHRTAP